MLRILHIDVAFSSASMYNAMTVRSSGWLLAIGFRKDRLGFNQWWQINSIGLYSSYELSELENEVSAMN